MNILLLSHGFFCKGLLDSYCMVVGKNENIQAINLDEKGIGDFRARLQQKVEELLKQGDLLIYTDIKGGTPYNEAFGLMLQNTEHIRVVTGMNLPMLIETGLNMEEHNLQSLYELALECGAKSVEGAEYDASDDEDEIEF